MLKRDQINTHYKDVTILWQNFRQSWENIVFLRKINMVKRIKNYEKHQQNIKMDK